MQLEIEDKELHLSADIHMRIKAKRQIKFKKKKRNKKQEMIAQVKEINTQIVVQKDKDLSHNESYKSSPSVCFWIIFLK